MNKKTFVVIVSVMAIVIIALGTALAVVLAMPNNRKNENSPDFHTKIQNSEHVVLSVSNVSTTSSNGVSKSISATVLPATASNKKVDWTVTWSDETQTGNVSEYVTVTPISDGSTQATVTCHKAFAGEIIVTATTREGGFSAHCIVTYVGVPTDIKLTGEVSPSNGVYKLGIGRTYVYDVQLTNALNSVGANFNDFEVTVGGYGAIKVGDCEYTIASGSYYWYEDSIKTVQIFEIADAFVEASYANGKLSITTKKTFENYYTAKKSIDGFRRYSYTDKYKETVEECSISIVIHEKVSNVRASMTIKFDENVVTGVTITNPTLEFWWRYLWLKNIKL